MNNIEFMKLMVANAAPPTCPWVTSFSSTPRHATPEDWCVSPAKHAGQVPWVPSAQQLLADPATAGVDGEERAELLFARLLAKAADRELMLRSLLDLVAEDGRVIPPTASLRAWCARLQERLAPTHK